MKILSFALFLIILGCGSEREITPVGQGGPPVVTPGTGTSVTFAEIQPLLRTYCSRCHSGAQFLTNEAAWKASSARQRTNTLQMPPGSSNEARQLSATDRAKITSFQ